MSSILDLDFTVLRSIQKGVLNFYLIRVGPVLMFSPIRSITECFGTAREFTRVGLFASVRS